MIKSMAQVHMTEAELAQDLHEVLDKARHGVEVVIEDNHRPVAVIRSLEPTGRLLAECEASGSSETLDEGFMKDVEEGIANRSKPWKPPSWE
jgi:antitoxin (DNA-binding transcriptional repressor) of toxin-antitoxin stability system